MIKEQTEGVKGAARRRETKGKRIKSGREGEQLFHEEEGNAKARITRLRCTWVHY